MIQRWMKQLKSGMNASKFWLSGNAPADLGNTTMAKTITMEYSEYQKMEREMEAAAETIVAAHNFEDQLEELLLSSKEKEIKHKPFWNPLTRSQLLERVELMVNRFTDKDYEAAIKKWEKQLG